MSHVSRMEAAERLVGADPSRVIAYQLGRTYPGFVGADRAQLAAVFDRHGFGKVAESIRDVTAEKALSTTVGKVGTRRRDGLRLDPLHADTTENHVKAWGIYLVERRPGERQSHFHVGARVWCAGDVIDYAPPVDAPSLPAALDLGKQIVADAICSLTMADSTDVSRALDAAITEAGAMPFLSRGVVVAPVGFPETDRLVALYRDLRAEFYSDETRVGLRAACVGVTQADTDAVSDAVLDDLEERLADAAAKLREEAGSGTVRAATLQRRRDDISALANLARERAAWLGTRAARFAEPIACLQAAYAGAVSAATMAFPESLRAIAEGHRPAASAPESAPPSEPAPEPAPVAPPVPEPVAALAEPATDNEEDGLAKLLKLFD